MAEEKTTIIAKVGAKIYPVTDQFYREAKRDLKVAEDRLDEVEVDVTLGDNRVLNQLKDLLRRLNEKARQDTVKVDAKLDETGVMQEAERLKEKLDKKLDDVKIRTQIVGGKYKSDDAAADKILNELRGRLKTERAVAKVNSDSMRDQLANNGKIGDQLKNQLKVEKLIAKANKDASDQRARASEAQQRAGAQQLQAEKEMQRALRDAAEAQQRAGQQQLAAEREMQRTFDERARATRQLAEDQQRAGREQLAAQREMTREFADRAKSQRKALADQARMTREMANTTRESKKLREQVDTLKIKKLIDNDTYADLNKLQRELDTLHAELKITVDPENRERIKHEAAKIKDDIEDELDDVKAEVEPNVGFAQLKYVQAVLSKLARTRFVTFVPQVSKAGAARVATALAALSGARGANKLLEDLGDATKNLDKNLPKIAVFAEGLLGLAAWAGQAASNLFSLANSIASIGPAALGLPGILGGVAIGVGISLIAFKDFNKQIPEAKKGWEELKKTIRGNFWEQAEAPIRRLGTELFPQLKAGIGAASTELGKFFGGFADGIRKELGGNPLKNMFEDLRKSIDITTDHTGQMAKIIRILGESGAGLLPRMATYFGELTDKFSDFLDKADKDGSLQDWIDTGIQGLMDLGNIIGQTARIFSGLGKAALAGGGSTLKTLGDTLEDIANVVNGPVFQKALIGVLSAANKAMETIARVSGPAINDMFLTLAGTLQQILPIVGSTLGLALKTLAKAIADPALQKGIVDLFNGIGSAVASLAPAFKTIAPAFGSLLSVLGTAAKTFAPIGALILETVGKAFIRLAPAIQVVIQSLGGAFLSVLKAVAPVIDVLAKALAPVIADLGVGLAGAITDVAPYIAEIAGLLGQALIDSLKSLSDWLPQLVRDLFPKLLEVVKNLAPKLPEIVDAFLGLVDVIVKSDLIPKLSELAGQMLDFLLILMQNYSPQVLQGLIDGLSDVAGSITQMLDAASSDPESIQRLGDLAKYTGEMLKTVLDIAAGIIDFFTAFSSAAKGLVTLDFGGFSKGVSDAMTAVWDILTAIPNAIFNLMTGTDVSDTMHNVGQFIMRSLVEGMSLGLGAAGGLWTFLAWLTSEIPNHKGPESVDATLLTPAGESIMQSLINGLGNKVGDLWTKLGEVTSGLRNKFSGSGTWLLTPGGALMQGLIGGIGKKFEDVKTAAKTALQKAKDGTNGSDTTLKSAGISVIDGFVRYIRAGFDRVQGVLSDLTNLLPEWKGPRSTDKVILKEAGQLVIQGFVEGLTSQFGLVKNVLGDLSDDIAGTQLAAPTIGKINSADVAKLRAGVSAQVAVAGDAAGQAPVAEAPIVFNIENHNPVAEPTSVTTTKALRTAGQMGVLRK